MGYLTSIEERSNNVLYVVVHESNKEGAKTVALLACVRGSDPLALAEALRVGIESLKFAGTG